MATVTVPPAFFRGELRVYGDWREALARELLQNSTDANPTRIDVTLSTVDGHGRIVFSDDGHGMTRDVLERVFFALGETTKTGEDSIGGFGRARIIICFAQARYTIRTRNLIAEGVGGEYTIREVAEHVPGATFTIDLIDDSCDKVEAALNRLLRTCTLPVPVTVNGSLVRSQPMPVRAARVLRDETGPWGRVYLSSGYGRVNVRVHGLTMFTRWLSGSDDVILELVPSRSRQVLSASRDQLRAEYAEQLDQWVADLAGNRRRALRPPDEPLDVRIGGGGFLASDADTAPEPQHLDDSDTALTADAETGRDGLARAPQAGGTLVGVRPGNAAAFRHAAEGTGVPATLFGIPEVPALPALGFDVYLLAEANDTRVRRLRRAWDPMQWDARTGLRRRALLLAWKGACEYALDLLVAAHPDLGRVLWTVGWIFDEGTRGLHKSVGTGHVLALNPVTGTGGARYHLSRRTARHELFAVAAHEVAHIVAENHDERFASILTMLYAAADPVEADRRIRASMAGR